jgi:succinoglycan biosynthesis transport protein ExoP
LLGDSSTRDELDARLPRPSSRQTLTVEGSAAYAMANPWFDEPTNEEGLDLARYFRVLLKHRWIIITSIVGASAIGLGVTLLMTPIFSANATLKIDRESARIVDTQSIEPHEDSGGADEFFQTQYGLLKSRALAMDVIDRLGLSSGDAFFKSMRVRLPQSGPGSTAADRRRKALDIFQKKLGVAPVRGSRLVTVSFDSPDPVLAARVANSVAEEFIASNLNRRYESSDYARQFLEGKLAEVKAKLEASEHQAADYATREKIINVAPTTEDSRGTASQSLEVTSLVALNSALSTARGERIKAEQRWRQSLLASPDSLPEVLQNLTIQDLIQTRAKLQGEYQEKRKVFKPEFQDMVALQARINELDSQIQQEVHNIQNSLKINYDVALNQEHAFEAQVQKLQGSTLDMDQRTIQYSILQREADTNRTLYEGLLQRYKEIGVAGGISTNNISIVDRADVPVKPSKPKPILNLLLAALTGAGLGIMLAFVLELLDESIATPEDIEGKLGLPLLGSVPKLFKGETPTVALNDERSAFSEAYYSIRTALQFSTAQGAPQTILITSSRPSEGKSTTAYAVAKNFARVGINVLLVDGDMRNPSMHRLVGADNSQGLSNVMTGSLTIEQAAIQTDTAFLTFLPCGPLPPNPAQLLASAGLSLFLEAALKSYSMVVIDGPPVLGLADAPTLAAAVEGTVFVVESKGTRRGLGKTAVQRLLSGRARILGGILTKFDAKKSAYGYGAGYAYAYDYSYGEKRKISGS